MKALFYKIFILSLLLMLGSCGQSSKEIDRNDASKSEAEKKELAFVKEGELKLLDSTNTVIKEIEIEVAQNDYERERGLMYRPFMPENAGMLFIFPREEYRAFWMKNTIISLDILFIGSDLVINTIHTYTVPYSEESVPSAAPAVYVLELNAGYCDNNGIREGMKIEYTISAENKDESKQ